MTATETGADAQAPAGLLATGLTPVQRLKAIAGGSAGNLVEWYDWFAYSSFALYFAKHFFPDGDQTAQLLQAAAVFAIGFLARPVGASEDKTEDVQAQALDPCPAAECW